MASRIMMTVSGKTRPLTLSSGETPIPLLNSSATRWAGLPIELHVLRPIDSNITTGPCRNDNGILVIMSGQVEIVLREDKRDINLTSAPGSAYMLSGNHPLNLVRIAGSAEAAAIDIPDQWFGRLLLDGPPPNFGLTEPLLRDQTVFSIVRAMCDEVTSGSSTGRLYGESLSMALLSYVVERMPSSTLRARGRLSDAQCRRLQKHIRDLLHEDLSLIELASVVNLSPRHFSTLFREAFGMTPHQYVLRNRLAEGARLLESEGQDIVEIALRLGFSSQSHFTSAFRRAFGVTPSRYATAKRKSFSVSVPGD
jgi:AraC-like DNA-binding protein